MRDAGPESAFDRVAAAFERRGRRGQTTLTSRTTCSADAGFGCEWLDGALATRIRRPFAHLQDAALIGDRVELEIDLWDERETNVAHPSDSSQADLHAVESGGHMGRGGVGRQRGVAALARRREAARPVSRADVCSASWARGNHLVGPQGRTGDRLASVRVHLGPQEQSKPLPLLLGIWYYDCDIHVVHAGLVAWRGQGVLVGGGSGAGKSTTTLACLQTGFEFLGDDQCGLQALEGGSFVGHSLYGGARVAPSHTEHFPQLRAAAGPRLLSGDDKLLLFPAEVLPTQLARDRHNPRIVLPRVVAAEQSRVRRASKGEALLRLAPTSLFTAFGAGAARVRAPGAARGTHALLLAGARARHRLRFRNAWKRCSTRGSATMSGVVPSPDLPRVSCIVPVYNGEAFLRETLDSIVAQTHRELDVIVVDDGSTDGTRDLVAQYEAPLRYVWQANAGPSTARNTGLRAAQGEYVAFLDADDLWHPGKLARQVALLEERPAVGACVTLIQNFWDDALRDEHESLRGHPREQPMAGYTSVTLLARRSVFEVIGGFDTTLEAR